MWHHLRSTTAFCSFNLSKESCSLIQLDTCSQVLRRKAESWGHRSVPWEAQDFFCVDCHWCRDVSVTEECVNVDQGTATFSGRHVVRFVCGSDEDGCEGSCCPGASWSPWVSELPGCEREALLPPVRDTSFCFVDVFPLRWTKLNDLWIRDLWYRWWIYKSVVVSRLLARRCKRDCEVIHQRIRLRKICLRPRTSFQQTLEMSGDSGWINNIHLPPEKVQGNGAVWVGTCKT